MLQEIESRDTPQARVQQIGRLTTFLGDIAESILVTTSPSGQDRKINSISAPVEKTLLLFAENIAHDWSINELSASFGLNTSYYIRLFKQEIGESPLSYLSRIRARHAAQLLLRSECSVTQVGTDVGWSDLGYFSRRFRHYFGISPREYRHKYRDFTYTS